MTQTGVVIGTPEYMSPEQARGLREISPSADIFSLGCVFYETLTGLPPFIGEHLAALMARILFEAAPSVAAIRPVPLQLDTLIHRMLAKEPGQRPRDVLELLELLRAIPLGATDSARIRVPPPPARMTGAELQLVSVVIATESELFESEQATLGTHEAANNAAIRETLAATLTSFRAQIEWLADGSLCATLARPGSAPDQVTHAARMALAIHERWPSATIALATGRGIVQEQLPVGEAIDRAVGLLRRMQDAAPAQAPTADFGVWLDDLSADLIQTQFVIEDLAGSRLLRGARTSIDETRLLLGKPTSCVGREQELAMLDAILARIIDEGSAQAVLIQGGPGMGKSRLRHEFLRRVAASHQEIELLIGRGDPMSAGAPYGLLAQGLRRLCGIQGSEDLPTQKSKLQKRIIANLPESTARRITDFLGELCAIPFEDSDTVQLRAARNDPKVMSDQVAQAFLDFLHAETTHHPFLIVLEDLQWGDPLTVKLLDTALRELSQRPLLVLALARPEISDLFPRLWVDHVQELNLRGLGKRACERLVQQILGPQVAPALISQIVTQADGNALFLEELIRAVAGGKGDGLPETVLAMLQARLMRLETGARRLLRAASIFGETFWCQGVKALLSMRITQGEMDTWLNALIKGELIEHRRDSRFAGDEEYGFRHALVRDAAYSLLPDEDRRVGHRLAASYLRDVGESDPRIIAKHFLLGQDHDRAVPYLIRAAEQSLASNDLRDTLSFVNQGMASVSTSLSTSGQETAREKNEAMGTLQSIGCSAHFWCDEFAIAYPLGIGALKALPTGSLRWIQTLGHMLTITSLTGRLAHFGELVGTFSAVQPNLAARGAYVEAASLLTCMFSFGGARDPARSLLGLMLQTGEPILEQDPMARTWLRQGHLVYMLMLEANPSATCTIAEDGLRAAVAASARRQQVLIAGLGGMALAAIGDHAAAEAQLRNNLELAQRLRETLSITHAKVFLGMALAYREDARSAKEVHSLAQDVLSIPGVNHFYLACAHNINAWSVLALGDLSGAEEAARKAGQASQMMPTMRCMALTSHLLSLQAASRTADALALCDEAEDLLFQVGCASYAEVPLRLAMVETYLKSGDGRRTAEALAQASDALEMRAASFADSAAQERFLNEIPAHVRLRALLKKSGPGTA